jgi:hypothetical protein
MTKPTKTAAAPRAPKSGKPAKKPGTPRAAKAPRPKGKKPEIIRRKLVWREALIAIQYKSGDTFGFAHLEVRAIAPTGIPLPVTETGYRSHYVYPLSVRNAGGVVSYVRRWLDSEATTKTYLRALERWRQLDLFDA